MVLTLKIWPLIMSVIPQLEARWLNLVWEDDVNNEMFFWGALF